MDKTLATEMSVKVIEKPSFFQKLKGKITSFRNSNDNKDVNYSNKKRSIYFISLALISLFIIVSTIYKSLEASPIPKIDNLEAQNIMSSLYSTQWIYDEPNESTLINFNSKIYKKIEFYNKMDDSSTKLPIKLYEEDNNLSLGMELGYLYYSKTKKNLILILPNAQELKFLYTKSSSSNIENLSLINEKNNRIYFVKKEFVK